MRAGRASWTARWVATQRAGLHDQRPVCGDAAAELRLYRHLSMRLLEIRLAAPTGLALRTSFIDNALLDAVEHGARQVVLVGAGYDGRALRFSDLPVTWFEVDHPATQADKRRRLAAVGAATGKIRFVTTDLLGDRLGADLAEAGHDPAQPSAWVCEGLFPYLSQQGIDALCQTLRARSGSRSALISNVLVRPPRSRALLARQAADGLLAALGERRLSEFGSGDCERFLAAARWHVDRRASTTPARVDGAYVLATAASPARDPR